MPICPIESGRFCVQIIEFFQSMPVIKCYGSELIKTYYFNLKKPEIEEIEESYTARNRRNRRLI